MQLNTLHSGISQGASALELAISTEQVEQLALYIQLILKWNHVYNLTAIRDPAEVLTHHVLDCLSVVKPIQAAIETIQAPHIMDVGAGAGLPSVVLALMLAPNVPGLRVTAVDTVGKKAAFIAQAAATLKLPQLHAEHARVEQLPAAQYAADLITSRAFASLLDFTALTAPLLKPTGRWAAMKGKDPHDEQLKLPASVQIEQVQSIQVPGLDAQRCIVWMRQKSQ